LFCVQKIQRKSKSYTHFGQKKRALPQLSEKSLIETRPCHFGPLKHKKKNLPLPEAIGYFSNVLLSEHLCFIKYLHKDYPYDKSYGTLQYVCRNVYNRRHKPVHKSFKYEVSKYHFNLRQDSADNS